MPSSPPATMTLSLKDAEAIAAGAIEHAKKSGIKITVTVADAGGRFIVVKRMNGAAPKTVDRSEGKAIGSAGFNLSTGRLAHPDGKVGHTHEQVIKAEGGRMLLEQGGVAIFRDGLAVGSCGVDGGTGEQDEACARAGLAKLQA